MIDRKSTGWKFSLTQLVFKKYTDSIGGDPNEFADILYNRFDVDCEDYSNDDSYNDVTDYFIQKVVPHKIHVFNAGYELLAKPWIKNIDFDKEQFIDNLWLHDLSKFSKNEALPYATHDFSKGDRSPAFAQAWVHHKNSNPHHPEYWLNPSRSGVVDPLPMPDIYILEMFADWIGAGRTYGGELETWLPKNFKSFTFHPETSFKVHLIANRLNINV